MDSHNDLKELLTRAEVPFTERNDPLDLHVLSSESRWLICHPLGAAANKVVFPSSGSTFWCHAFAGIAVVGLWSGFAFFAGSTTDLVKAASRLVRLSPIGEESGPPCNTQYVIIEEAGFPQAHFITVDVSCAGPSTTSPENDFAELIGWSAGAHISPKSLDGELLHVSLGHAQAMARIIRGSESLTVKLMFIGHFGQSDDHVHLLRLLTSISDGVTRDDTLKNLVLPDDDYYFSTSVPRPKAPRNLRAAR